VATEINRKNKDRNKGILSKTPSNEAIWRSFRLKDITREVLDLQWKHIHGIAFWEHIPGLEERAECPLCDKYDTFGHIVVTRWGDGMEANE